MVIFLSASDVDRLSVHLQERSLRNVDVTFLLYVEQKTAALVLNLDEHTVGRLFNLVFR